MPKTLCLAREACRFEVEEAKWDEGGVDGVQAAGEQNKRIDEDGTKQEEMRQNRDGGNAETAQSGAEVEV